MGRRKFFGGVIASIANMWAQPAQRGEPVRVLLTERGFEPRQITVKPGIVDFVVRSRLAGRADIEVVEAGRSDSRLSASRNKSRSSLKDRTVLAPGVYEIRDRRFPQWKCTVNVRP